MSDEIERLPIETMPSETRITLSFGNAPKEKRYLTRYLPGDIAHCLNGSIGIIKEARCICVDAKGSTRHLQWNWRWDRPSNEIDIDPGKIIQETYSLDVIPGYQCGRLAWYEIDEFKEVIKGPLHDALGGRSGLDELPTVIGRARKKHSSSVAPLGRPRVDWNRRVTRRDLFKL